VITEPHVAGHATRIVVPVKQRGVPADWSAPTLAIFRPELNPKRHASSRRRVAIERLRVGVPSGDGSPCHVQSVTLCIVAPEMVMPQASDGAVTLTARTGLARALIGHDADIYPGNSGGPLVNLQGR